MESENPLDPLRRYQGLVFEDLTEEPADFRVPPEGLTFVIVSERVASLARTLNCTNVVVTPCEDVVTTSSVVEVLRTRFPLKTVAGTP